MKGNDEKKQKKQIQLQQDIVRMFQQSINSVKDYLSIINVPINNNKTQLMIIQRMDMDTKKNGLKQHQNNENKCNQISNDMITRSKYWLDGEEIEKNHGSNY